MGSGLFQNGGQREITAVYVQEHAEQDFLSATSRGRSRVSSAALLLSFQTTNSSPPSDSQGARSCHCSGALGGGGQPRKGQVCRHSNGM